MKEIFNYEFDVPKREYWLCLMTQPNREKLAKTSLLELGFNVYVPLCRRLVLRRAKRVSILAPLFSRYLFVAVTGDKEVLYDAKRAHGVSCFAGRTLEQSFVSSAIIDAIMEREDADGVIGLDQRTLLPGQKVRILEGPLAGLDAAFSEPDGQKRSFILLDLLGKPHRLVVPNQALALAA